MPVFEIGQAWFLQSPGATYALGVTPEGYLQHWHWGGLVRPARLDRLRPWTARSYTVALPAEEGGERSLETLPAEYPFGGTGDFRVPAIEVEHADGTRLLRLKYRAHRIFPGKPPLPGLPSTYVESPAEAETLEIDLVDELQTVEVTLRYTVFAAHDAIARSARVTNRGRAPVRLLAAASASIDLGERTGWSWLHLSGAWTRERQVVVAPLRPGHQTIASHRGASSHQHNPFFALLAPQANEDAGEVYGFSLVYSGNFAAGVELDHYAAARCQLGLNSAGFSWLLAPGEAFQTPEAVLVYSGEGLGGMSRTYHALYRMRLCRGKHRDARRPVLINNWEATYFDFDQERLLDLARRAAGLGLELFVLDDGWFGRRDDDRSSLGDWTPHRTKLPEGVAGIAEKIRSTGLQFGLWFEPEMVSEDSDLYRAHPDWCLRVADRSRSPGRHQFVLDFSRPEVRAAIYDQMAALLRGAPVHYIKWDMNRHLSEVASAGRPAAQQAETAHRYVLGLYEFLERLTGEFPDILFEGCAGGGGRFDPGMLHYMPQIWTSDNSDAISRLRIQYGTSLVYPLSTMAAHVSVIPNHQIGRSTPLFTRALVAMTGAFGLEMDLAKCSPAELSALREIIARYQAWAPLIATGNLYRLKNPFETQEAAWMIVAPDQTAALVCHVRILTEGNAPPLRLRLRGLRGDWTYRDSETGELYPGDALLAHGWVFEAPQDFFARAWHLVRVASS